MDDDVNPSRIIERSTTGITTKVVTGSVWTLAGSVIPLAVAFISTPFVIRFLGSEGYGVLLFVGLIPTYFAFADLGMGVAAMRYGSHAFGENDLDMEGRVIRTAAAIALVGTGTVALILAVAAPQIVNIFGVSEVFRGDAITALRLASLSFVIGICSFIVSTPLISRLRLDITTVVNLVPKVLVSIGTPIVLYLGFSLAETVWLSLVCGSLGFAVILYISHRFVPEIRRFSIDFVIAPALVRFGGAWMIGVVAGTLLGNVEKLLLSKFVSVEALAFYSVAFTLANMATTFSSAMVLSLVPVFTQLLAQNKRDELSVLFVRGMRVNVVLLLPVLVVLLSVAKPFFTIWAGPRFGEVSTGPFYVLLVGLFFGILAFIPHTTITSAGRTDLFAKLYWLELAFYAVIAYFFIQELGIIGAALAWTVRTIVDAILIVYFSSRVANISYAFAGEFVYLLPGALFLVPLLVVVVISDSVTWRLSVAPLCLCAYCVVAWKFFLRDDERKWISVRAASVVSRLRTSM